MTLSILFTIALTDYGWIKNVEKLEIQWDTPENVVLAKQKVNYVLNGCKCKTGCHSRVCGCKKKNKNCGPGCRCIGCGNGPSINTYSNVAHFLDDDGDTDELHCLEVQDILNESSDEGYTDESDDDTDQFRKDLDLHERDVDSIMAHVFGDDDDDYEDIL